VFNILLQNEPTHIILYFTFTELPHKNIKRKAFNHSETKYSNLVFYLLEQVQIGKQDYFAIG